MTTARLLFISTALMLCANAHATVYKCVDEQGRVAYTNTPDASQDCSTLRDDLPFSAIAGPTRLPETPAQTTSDRSELPSVSDSQQRSRDDTRQQVLQEELDQEREALQEAEQALEAERSRDAPEDRNVVRQRADGSTYRSINLQKREQRLQPYRDQVDLHQRNIEALKEELSNLR